MFLLNAHPAVFRSGILQARITDLQLFGRSTAGNNRLCCISKFQSYGSLFCLQSVQFLSQLEEFSSQYSLGLSALKNLVKTVLIISINTTWQLQWLVLNVFCYTFGFRVYLPFSSTSFNLDHCPQRSLTCVHCSPIPQARSEEVAHYIIQQGYKTVWKTWHD